VYASVYLLCSLNFLSFFTNNGHSTRIHTSGQKYFFWHMRHVAFVALEGIANIWGCDDVRLHVDANEYSGRIARGLYWNLGVSVCVCVCVCVIVWWISFTPMYIFCNFL